MCVYVLYILCQTHVFHSCIHVVCMMDVYAPSDNFLTTLFLRPRLRGTKAGVEFTKAKDSKWLFIVQDIGLFVLTGVVGQDNVSSCINADESDDQSCDIRYECCMTDSYLFHRFFLPASITLSFFGTSCLPPSVHTFGQGSACEASANLLFVCV